MTWWLTAAPAFLSHKKEQIWVSSSEVDEPRAYYTEQSKPETEKKMQYINAYIWNLEKNDIDGPICREGMEMQM